jgi:flagellar motor switch protein FliM
MSPDQLATAEDQNQAAKVEPLDFSQPTKFVPELRRRIALVFGPFLKSTAMRLAGELKAPVELHIVETKELAWSAARSTIAENQALIELEVKPIGAQMLLAVELPFLLRAIECLLGGSAANAPVDRRLTEIDLALVGRIVETIVAQLSGAWRDLGGLELVVGDIDVEQDHEASVEVQLAEPTYQITLACHLAGLPSRFDILLPWLAIEPVTGTILEAGNRTGSADPRTRIALRKRLTAVQIQLHAEIGARELPLARVVQLRAGEVLPLRTKAARGVRIAADRLVLGYGQPGRSGARKAVKLTTPLAPVPGPALEPPPDLRQRDRRVVPALDAAALAKLGEASVRVWAELGRTVLPLETVLGLPPGAVIELEELAEEPVYLYANGLRFGCGELIVDPGEEWAVRVIDPSRPSLS